MFGTSWPSKLLDLLFSNSAESKSIARTLQRPGARPYSFVNLRRLVHVHGCRNDSNNGRIQWFRGSTTFDPYRYVIAVE
jgi:hypothetical protein